MIRQLTNFTKKSFNNYSTPPEYFKNKNLIFGYNGRGKSSLSEGIIIEFNNQYGVPDNYRYFNRDYINESLILEDPNQDSILKGVSATFSKKDVDTSKQINTLKQMIATEEPVEERIELLKEATRKLIDTKHDEKKGNLNIKKKTKNKSLDDIMKLYSDDIVAAKKIQGDEQILLQNRGDDALEKSLHQLETLHIPDLSIEQVPDKDLEVLSTILINTYGNVDIPTSEVINWLNNGLHLHQDEDECKFCGNQIDFPTIKVKILEYNENEKQKAEVFIDTYRKKFNQQLQSLRKNTDIKVRENLANYLDSADLDDIFITITETTLRIETILELIDEKISEMSKSFIFAQAELKDAINVIAEKDEKLRRMKNEKLNKIRKQNANQEILVKGAIGLSIVQDKLVQENLKEIIKFDIELRKLKQNNHEIKSQIQELQNTSSDHEDFRKFLNTVLRDIEIDLELLPHQNGRNYTLRHSRIPNTPLMLESISEGEKNLLALLFFYFELYQDNEQKNLKTNIDLIVIDDPVSSLDEANKFYVLEMMKKILKERNVQVFILTHVWNDFCQLSYGTNSGLNTLEVYKNSNSNSSVRTLTSNDKPYKKLFKEIYTFSRNNGNISPTDCELYHIPNSMRRVFEEFLLFKSDSNIIPTQAQRPKIEDIIIKSTDGKTIDGRVISSGTYLNSNKKNKLGELLTLINVLSHSAQHNPNQVLTSAKFLMKLIEDMDSVHYNAMRC